MKSKLGLMEGLVPDSELEKRREVGGLPCTGARPEHKAFSGGVLLGSCAIAEQLFVCGHTEIPPEGWFAQ